jgi:NADH dehydrogenase
MTNTLVIMMGDGNMEKLSVQNVIWAAGITGNTLEGIPTSALTRGNRFLVDRFNGIAGLDPFMF